jgi:Fe-S oxidoreductase
LQTTFSNLENNGSPWAFSPAERADWADGLDVNIAANHPDFDILFWVGCSGSFDDRAKKVSVAFAKLMKIAGVNFAILGQEEMCNGDVARRSGNEYLADILVKQNIETFNKYNVKKIVTICPHCFNTFKNEYPDFGGNYEVIHHTDFLNDLIAQGKLKLKAETGGESKKIAYHDSCYLGRYNQKYEAPRQIIKSFGDAELKEAKKNRDKAFCCGAGGGQMFLEETAGKRVNIERSEQLLETGAKTIASNCPFCLTMLTDGLKVMDKIEEVEIKDIAELLLERVEQ